MKKILRGLHNNPINKKLGIEDWNSIVKDKFGPFVKKKSLLTEYRQLWRTELINLKKIERDPKYFRLFKELLIVYHRVIRKDHFSAIQNMVTLFQGTVTADENWMSLFMRAENPSEASIHDSLQIWFDWMDSILEGSYKHHFRVFYAFLNMDEKGRFPSDTLTADFGRLVSQLPVRVRSKFALLYEDSKYGIPVNQWRNIAAHKTFSLTSSRTLDITYGLSPKMRTMRVTVARIKMALDWTIKSLDTLRLASVIVFLENMKELKIVGIPNASLRLESILLGIFHNLRLVKFFCVGYAFEGDAFILSLVDTDSRQVKPAIIHASQILDQLSHAVQIDVAVKPTPKFVAVKLVDVEMKRLAQATIAVTAANDFSEKRITMKKYVDQMEFEFDRLK